MCLQRLHPFGVRLRRDRADGRPRFLSEGVRRVGGVLLPTTCPCCGTRGEAPCAGCRARLRPPPAAPPPAGVDEWVALLSYEGVGRELVARLKYRNARSALAWLADGLAGLVDPAGVDVVTWAPTTEARRRARGFDQAELLALAVARRLRRPCRRLVHRGPGPPQTGRAGAERRRGLGMRSVARTPRSVLVVDDVATTGATVASVAAALRGSGTVEVRVATAARTPAHPGRLPSAGHAVDPGGSRGHQGQWPSHGGL